MSTPVEAPTDQSAASLVSGILGDLRDLVEEQFQLTRAEIEDELRKQASAAAVLAVGTANLYLGAIVICLMLTHLLHWMTSPPGTDPAWFPLWACYAVVGAVLVMVGGVLTQMGRARFRSVNRTQNPATEIFQESVR